MQRVMCGFCDVSLQGSVNAHSQTNPGSGFGARVRLERVARSLAVNWVREEEHVLLVSPNTEHSPRVAVLAHAPEADRIINAKVLAEIPTASRTVAPSPFLKLRVLIFRKCQVGKPLVVAHRQHTKWIWDIARHNGDVMYGRSIVEHGDDGVFLFGPGGVEEGHEAVHTSDHEAERIQQSGLLNIARRTWWEESQVGHCVVVGVEVRPNRCFRTVHIPDVDGDIAGALQFELCAGGN